MADIEADLTRLGWTWLDLQVRFGVHRNTITSWRRKPPGYVLAYLRVMLLLKEALG